MIKDVEVRDEIDFIRSKRCFDEKHSILFASFRWFKQEKMQLIMRWEVVDIDWDEGCQVDRYENMRNHDSNLLIYYYSFPLSFHIQYNPPFVNYTLDLV